MFDLTKWITTARNSVLILQVLALLLLLFPLKIYREALLKTERVLYLDKVTEPEEGIACAVLVPEGSIRPVSLMEIRSNPELRVSNPDRLDELLRQQVPWTKIDKHYYYEQSAAEIFATALQTRP